jgi:acetylaranotin biosynthesis cluster protein L
MKASNALPFVPAMQKCDVVERGPGWLIRDILLKDMPLREKVIFEPERRVIFERIAGDERGRIENVIGEDADGNLTLTFSFGLTKEGLAEGSEAERKHFSPMEGMYMGAVGSTLAAVRRTVDERGRAGLPLTSELDAEGDTAWIYEFFRSADSLDIDRTAAHMTEDARLQVGNQPSITGVQNFRAAISGLWSQLNGMSHSVTGAWSLHGGRVGVGECITIYTRLDGSFYFVNSCSVLRRRGDKIQDLRIFADVNQL